MSAGEEEERCLTVAQILEASSKESLDEVTNLEILFTPVARIAALDLCPRLAALTLIETGLARMSGLRAASETLTKLSLIGHGLERIEGLDGMLSLRELYLQDNNIARIGGLDGCPNLQRLWLYNNRIARIENLECVPDLRELWLQKNRIARIENLESLVNLQTLHLSANAMADFKDLQCLAKLPALSDISFSDLLFGRSPLANQDGYRNFVIFYLKQIRMLDYSPVHTDDRESVQDMYLKSVLAFNDEVDELKRKNAGQVKQLEHMRAENEKNTELMKNNLVEALWHLEKAVQEGRSKIKEEHARQLRLRKDNKKKLKVALASIKDDYGKETARLVAAENALLERAERVYADLKRRAQTEMEEAIFMLDLQATGEPAVCYNTDIGERSLEYRFVKTHLENANFNDAGANSPAAIAAAVAAATAAAAESTQTQGAAAPADSDGSGDGDAAAAPTTAGSTAAVRHQLVKVYKLYLPTVERTYVDHVARTGSEHAVERVYYCAPAETVKAVLRDGWPPVSSGSGIAFYRSAARAIAAQPASERGQMTQCLLLCRLAVGGAELTDARGPEGVPEKLSENGLSLVRVDGGAWSYFVASNTAVANPEYFLRLELPPVDEMDIDESLQVHMVEASLQPFAVDNPADRPGHAVLNQLEQRAASEFKRYQRTVWEDINPELWRTMEDDNAEIEQMQSAMESLRGQIAAEKAAQERLLRGYRDGVAGQPASGGGKKSGGPQPPGNSRPQSVSRKQR